MAKFVMTEEEQKQQDAYENAQMLLSDAANAAYGVLRATMPAEEAVQSIRDIGRELGQEVEVPEKGEARKREKDGG